VSVSGRLWSTSVDDIGAGGNLCNLLRLLAELLSLTEPISHISYHRHHLQTRGHREVFRAAVPGHFQLAGQIT
jgi:hypothetical protein